MTSGTKSKAQRRAELQRKAAERRAAELRANYDKITLNRNENTWSSQGVLANLGLVVLLGLLLHRKPVPRLLEGLSVLNIFGILLATTGG